MIPRCVITQGSGKHRIIDNAAEGGQSATSADPNKLVLCSPLRPAQHVRATIRRRRAECVVCFWRHEWQQPAFQVYAGLLFGLPLAVTSFNRYSRLVEALGRRLVLTLVSLYFDDATVGDWASSKGSGQWAFGQLNTLLGTPFADSKRQPMSHRGDFLHLSHDMSRALRWGRALLASRQDRAEGHHHAGRGGVEFLLAPRSGRQTLRDPQLLRARGIWQSRGREPLGH